MTKKHLSPEIVSLIHHVELNETGWWKKAVSQVVRAVLWKSSSPLTQQEVQTGLHSELGIQLQEGVLARQLELLISQGSVVRFPGLTFKLTEHTREQLSTDHAKAVAEQGACSTNFLAFCGEHCPLLDASTVWDEFSRALQVAIQVTDANLYHLLADGSLERVVDWLTTFLNKFEKQHQDGLRHVLAAFFAPANIACRNQVLRLLSAHFFAEATQLKTETLAMLESEKKVKTVRIVLDNPGRRARRYGRANSLSGRAEPGLGTKGTSCSREQYDQPGRQQQCSDGYPSSEHSLLSPTDVGYGKSRAAALGPKQPADGAQSRPSLGC